jgi:hypothetical protein
MQRGIPFVNIRRVNRRMRQPCGDTGNCDAQRDLANRFTEED